MLRTKEDVAAEGRKVQVAVLGGQMLEPWQESAGGAWEGVQGYRKWQIKEPERENTG